jgi:hypothetical protein
MFNKLILIIILFTLKIIIMCLVYTFVEGQELFLEFLGVIFMFIIVGLSIFLSIHYNKKVDTVKLKENYDYYKKYLDFFYMRNLYLTLFGILLYFLMSIGMFVILRYITLGSTKDIRALAITFNWKILLLFIITLICYKKSLDLLFYPEVIKLHIYLQQNETYIAIADYVINLDDCASNFLHKLTEIFMILSSLTFDYENHKKALAAFMSKTQKDYKVSFTKTNLILFKWRKIVLKHTYIRLILSGIGNFIFNVERYLENWLYILPYSLLFMILIYDLSRLELYYTYYGLFIYIIIIIIRKIRKFFYEKDPLLDHYLYKYYYEKDVSGISRDHEDMANYIINDFKVYHVLDEDRINTANKMRGVLKRFHMITLIFIGSIITYLNRAKFIITIDILGIEIPMILLFVPGIIMLYLLLKGKIINKHLAEYKRRYNIMFWVLGIIQMLTLLLMNLKNKSIIFANEVIFDFGIKVTEILTYEEKIKLMCEYISDQIKEKNINLIDQIYIIENWVNLDIKALITNELSIANLKLFTGSMIEVMLKMQEIYIKNIVTLNDKLLADIQAIANHAEALDNAIKQRFLAALVLVIVAYYLSKYIKENIYLIQDKNPQQHIESTYYCKDLIEAIKYLWNH